MNRDGANLSLWQYNQPDYQTTNPVSQTEFDVIVIGAGITGMTLGMLLQLQGLKCLVCEAHTVGFGTSSGTTAHLNTLLEADYSQVKKDFGEKESSMLYQAAKSAIDLVAHLSSTLEIACDFERKEAILFSQNQQQTNELAEIWEASNQAGLKMDYTGKIPVNIPFEKAVRMSGQAQMHPVKYIFGLARAFETQGGAILQNCLVQDVAKTDGSERLKVKTQQGNFIGKNVVYATHVPPGVNLLHFRNAPYKSYALAVTLKSADYPDELIYDMYDAYHYIRTQEADGKKVLIVGGEDHKTAEEINAGNRFDKLENYIRQYFDVENVLYKWSSQYFIPADGLPYIGKLPGGPDRLFVATGYAGNGITLSQVAAQVLTDIITNGHSEWENLFSPSRIKPVAGFTNFVKEGADVVGKLVAAPFVGEKIPELAALPKGSGCVVKLDGQQIALYKHTSGNIYALNPLCTHLKCSVAWNNSEKAWECPCHGSRFSADGEVLNAPATKPLEKIDLAGH